MDHLQRVKQEFRRQADHFAASAAITDGKLTKRLIEAVGPNAKELILDLACGPGIVSAALAPNAREVVAFDLTPEMLQKARQRCSEARLDNVTFSEGSATDLPFPDRCFDVVVTRLSIHHFKKPPVVLAEMLRVLNYGGRVVVADVVSSEDFEKSSLQNAIERLRDPSHIRMLPTSELVNLVEAAGFTIDIQDAWDTPRKFEEWIDIVDNPERVDPLRTIVRALARAGEDAGMGLSLADGEIVFFHRWHLIVGRKSLD
jgi:ubiquinone/menaquinone biosynthesis C-methylase UbiE